MLSGPLWRGSDMGELRVELEADEDEDVDMLIMKDYRGVRLRGASSWMENKDSGRSENVLSL